MAFIGIWICLMYNIFQKPLSYMSIEIELYCGLLILLVVNIRPEKGKMHWVNIVSGRPFIATENRSNYSFRTFRAQGNLSKGKENFVFSSIIYETLNMCLCQFYRYSTWRKYWMFAFVHFINTLPERNTEYLHLFTFQILLKEILNFWLCLLSKY